MITAFAIFPMPVESPEEAKESIRATLDSSGASSFELFLQTAGTDGYRFKIEADDTEENWTLLNRMFGAMNTSRNTGATPAMNSRAAKKAFQVAGSEGRFAKENPPPPWAK